MNYSEYRISLDIHRTGSQSLLQAKQGDTGRKIYVTLTENGKPYTISSDCTAVFTAKKPDGNILFNNCTIEDNIICYTFTEQTSVVPGKMDCEIRIYGADNMLITSPHFDIIVNATVYKDGDTVESTTEVNTLTSLISEATSLISSVNTKLENNEFVPNIKIGTVTTLSAGSDATANITGTGKNLVLNLGIPRGASGGIDGVDKELSLESENPVQNKVVTTSLNGKADKAENGTVVSSNADFAEVGWWLDGNPNNEDRTGYFVCIDDNVDGTAMRKATSTDDVRGVIVANPAFAGNASADKYDSNGNLLPLYDYVGVMGLVSVIDNGTCTVNGRCMPGDDGTAVPSSNNLGYHVIERIDSSRILIVVEPNGDMVQRIKTDIENMKDSGVSPTVAVSEIIGGHRITVTDKDGTRSFDVLDGSKGDKGDKGDAGPTGADGKDGAQGPAGADGAAGADGKDGVSCTHEWNGTILTVTSASGTSSADLRGPAGADGKDGADGAVGPQGQKGDQGDIGPQGPAGADGSDATVTADNIKTALGYAPGKMTYNLLDNSDFTNLVAQAGIGGNHGSQAYAADRWILTSGTVSYSAGTGLTLNGTITQKLENPPATATPFVGVENGTAAISYTDGAATITSSGGVIKWAALYEGEYSAETMPEYQTKGFGAELAECHRYFQSFNVAVVNKALGLAVARSSTTAAVIFNLSRPMRTHPTMTRSTKFKLLGNVTKTALTPIVESAYFNMVRLNFTTSGLTANEVYFAAADSTGYMDFSADL